MLITGLGAPLVLAACTPPVEELHDEDLRLDQDWQELLNQRGVEFQPTFARELEEIVLTPERLSALPDAVRREPNLARFAVARSLSDPVLYEGGVYGVVGATKVFVTSTDRINDANRLFWVEVKVLSEKYSCFIAAKQNLGSRTWVRCRDGRQVVIWTSKGPDWVAFHARQYDRDGYEVMVKHHRIVRISRDKML